MRRGTYDRLTREFTYVALDLEYVISWHAIECESLLSIVDALSRELVK